MAMTTVLKRLDASWVGWKSLPPMCSTYNRACNKVARIIGSRFLQLDETNREGEGKGVLQCVKVNFETVAVPGIYSINKRDLPLFSPSLDPMLSSLEEEDIQGRKTA